MPPEARLATARPEVTVVVATRDRRELLTGTLERVLALPDAPRVIVVDDGSRDGTPELVAERFGAVELVRLAGSGGRTARTLGAARATTPYVAFTDDDAHWAPGSLARAAAVLDAHPEIALIAPRILVGAEERLDPVSAEMLAGGVPDRPALPGVAILGFLACAVVVRRTAFLAAGGFPARYGIGGEERPLALDLAAAGWALRHVPEVVAHHVPPPGPDRPARRVTTLRNDLWTAWTFRPAARAAAESVRRLRAGRSTGEAARAVAAALRGARWVARERRPVRPPVAGWLDALDD